MWKSSEGSRQSERDNEMRMIVSEEPKVMSEPSFNFAYAAVTASRTNARGNTQLERR
jgi:hypothetical protein